MKISSLGLALALALPAVHAQETPVTTAPAGTPAASSAPSSHSASSTTDGASAPTDVLIVGQRPGPGMWKVSKGDHVMWVFATYGPLPTKMEWRSQQVEAALLASQEYLDHPGISITVGWWKGIGLLPHVIGLRNNPNGATLKDVLPPEVYARWTTFKQMYIGANSGIEKERPVFAAQTLYEAALQRAGLSHGYGVEKALHALVKKHGIKRTHTQIQIEGVSTSDMVKQFKKSPLEDVACLTQTMNQLETDIGAMRTRANAWAIGDLDKIERLDFREREVSCDDAMKNSPAIKPLFAGTPERLKALWLANAERALANNTSTFAVMQLSRLLQKDNYLAALAEKGYTVERPE